MQRILSAECLIFQYTNQSILRLPMTNCLKQWTYWKVIDKRGFLILSGSFNPKIKDTELECLALLRPVQPLRTNDTCCSVYNPVCKK